MGLGGTGAELITHGLTEEEEKMDMQRPGHGVRHHACHQPTSVERGFSMFACIILVSWFCSVMNIWCILILLWVSPPLPLIVWPECPGQNWQEKPTFPWKLLKQA